MRWTPFLLLLAACSEYDIKSGDEVDGTGPEITVTPLEIFYGELSGGETTKTESFNVANDGDATLEVPLLTIEAVGDAASTFTFGPDVSYPFILEPGEDRDIDVIYTSEDTSDQGLVRIVSNDDDEQETQVTLYGGFVEPKLLIDPPVVDFGSRMLNCYDSQEITLKNIGGDTLIMDEVYLDTEDFVIAEGPGRLELDPGQDTTVLVEFNPTAVGAYDGNLVVESNDPEGTKEGILMGSGDDLGECQALSIEAIVEYEIADVAFIFDTTCSMGPTSTAIAGEFSSIAAALQDEIDDVSFGVATFKDYFYAGYGGQGDLPFFLEQQITSDLTRVQNALSGPNMGASGGADWEESSFEALYQAAAGTGYDQDCDGEYDEDQDVLPFNRSSSTDVFYGTESGTYTAGLPDSGELGGMGFREDVLPVFILATDAPMRDPLNSYPVPPQACSWQEGSAASSEAAMNAVGALEGGVIGVAVNSGSGYVAEAAMQEQGMLTVQWSQSSSSDEFRDTIVEAVKSLIGTAVFDRVWLEVASDPYNMVDSVTPNVWKNVPSGTPVEFTVEVSSAIVNEPTEGTYPVLLEMYGEIDDENWLLNSYIYYVVIPESE